MIGLLSWTPTCYRTGAGALLMSQSSKRVRVVVERPMSPVPPITTSFMTILRLVLLPAELRLAVANAKRTLGSP